MKVVKFNIHDQPEFFTALKSRITQYFADNNLSRYANPNMVFKTIFMLTIYFLPMGLLISGMINNLWITYLMWVIMGFGMCGIGLSIMHDANHGSYSRHKWVNQLLGFTINFVGGYHVTWKIQHNVLHHTFTNIHDFDEDINKEGIMRFSPTQLHRGFFRFQILYVPVLYAIMTMYWVFSKDFQAIYRYHKKGLLKAQGITLRQGLWQIAFHKAWYMGLTLVLPMIASPFAWWQALLGFTIMHIICGLTLALVFQPAHVQEDTSFYKVDEKSSVENNWAIHQMRTTSNFGNGSKLFTWLVGGLNFQIEHHLFPNICHIHYPRIAKIVRETAQEFNVPYHSHKTFIGALRSHFSLLNKLGNPEPVKA